MLNCLWLAENWKHCGALFLDGKREDTETPLRPGLRAQLQCTKWIKQCLTVPQWPCISRICSVPSPQCHCVSSMCLFTQCCPWWGEIYMTLFTQLILFLLCYLCTSGKYHLVLVYCWYSERHQAWSLIPQHPNSPELIEYAVAFHSITFFCSAQKVLHFTNFNVSRDLLYHAYLLHGDIFQQQS